MYDWTINEYLLQVYEKRKSNNSRFSIRAFAQHLEISDSTLSQILRKKRPVGNALAKRFETKLKVKFNLTAEGISRKKIEYKDLAVDQSELEYPWYLFLLLELFKNPIRSFDQKALADKLGAPESELSECLDQLVKDQLLQKTTTSYKSTVEVASAFMNPPITTKTAKKYQAKTLDQSLDALMNIPFEKRIHNSLHFRFDSNQMPELRTCFRNFFRELSRLTLKHAKNSNSIYCMSASAFPLLDIEDMKK